MDGTKHPLTPWRFYALCFKYATSGGWGRTGDAALFLSLALPAWKAAAPHSYRLLEAYLAVHALNADILLWKLPLWAGVSILLLRLVSAPFLLYRVKPMQQLAATAAGESEPEPDILLELDATRSQDSTTADAVPITVRNIGAGAAMNVEIDPLETGDRVIGHNTQNGVPISPILTNNALCFPLLPELHSTAARPVSAQFDSNIPMEWAMLLHTRSNLGLWWFIDKHYDHLKYETARSLDESLPLQERLAIVDNTEMLDLAIPLSVRYWNGTQKRRWQRTETLNYSPSNRRAFITHGERVEITPSAPHTSESDSQ